MRSNLPEGLVATTSIYNTNRAPLWLFDRGIDMDRIKIIGCAFRLLNSPRARRQYAVVYILCDR